MLKVGIAVIGGSCLVFVSLMAISAYTSTTGAESTNLIGMPTSLRATSPALPMAIQNLPGDSKWKELAWAAMQGSSRCDRDISVRAAPVKAVFNRLSNKDKGKVAETMLASMEPGVTWNEQNIGTEGVDTAEGLIGPGDAEKILNGAGVTAPLGFWDPSGFATDITEGRLLFFREAELKHGRVCMLAFLGIVVGENYHPLFGGDIDIPAGKHFTSVSTDAFWSLAYVQNIFAIGFEEKRTSASSLDGKFLNGLKSLGGGELSGTDEPFIAKGGRLPGDLGFDPLGLKPKKEKDLVEMQTKELNNGRLAMFAVLGILVQEAIYGEKIFR